MKQYLWVLAALIAAAIAGAAAMRGYTKDHEAEDKILLLDHHIKTTDSIHVVDSLYFTRILKVEVAKHDTVLKHLADTVLVSRYIALQDSTIKACQSVVLDCEKRVAQRDSIIKIYKSLRPSRFSLGVQATCGLGLAARADCVIGGGVSFRIF